MKRNSLITIAALTLMLAVPQAQAGQAVSSGSLDTSFGTRGQVESSFSTSAWDVDLQSDGKIVVSGGEKLARYNTDGSLDITFGTGGIVTTGIVTSSVIPGATTIQADGKIIVANGNQNNIHMERYNSNGTLDTGFGVNGVVMTTVWPTNLGGTIIQFIALQSDGKILTGGHTTTAIFLIGNSPRNGAEFFHGSVLARHNANGTLDTTFGINGVMVNPAIDFASSNSIGGLAIQNDGKILVGRGLVSGGGATLTRYNPDSTLDTTFGTNGSVFCPSGCAFPLLPADGSGNILVLTSGGLARYTANGVLDNTFGIAGIAAVNTPNLLSSLALQDGKIIAAGAQVTQTTNRKGVTTLTRTFALSRYLANGAIDTTFGSSGLVTTAFASSTEAIIFNIAIQSDNKIVAVGRTGIPFFTPNFVAMARYNR